MKNHTLLHKALRDMPDLESKEYVTQRNDQIDRGVKIMTSNQMIRLPIVLRQFQTGSFHKN